MLTFYTSPYFLGQSLGRWNNGEVGIVTRPHPATDHTFGGLNEDQIKLKTNQMRPLKTNQNEDNWMKLPLHGNPNKTNQIKSRLVGPRQQKKVG